MSVRDQFTFMTRDFHSAWESLAKQSATTADGRGNFLFANHAMIVLEWCARVTNANEASHPGISAKFRKALFKQRKAYAAVLPLPTPTKTPQLHKLPFFVGHESTLLWFAFDVIRNGIAHTYWPQALNFTGPTVGAGGGSFILAITGVAHRARVSTDRGQPKKKSHLSYFDDGTTMGIWFHPGVAFTDIEAAARAAQLDALPMSPAFSYKPLDRVSLVKALQRLEAGRPP